MKKLRIALSLICLGSFLPNLQAIDVLVEFRMAGFFHSSERFKELYGNVGTSYQVELSTPISPCEPWLGWINFDWYEKHKHHDCFSKSKVEILNGSFGVKYNYQTCRKINLYLGAGCALGGISLKNKAHGYKDNSSKFLIGAVLKSGIGYTFPNQIYLEGFLDYLYQPVKFENRIDVGGIKLGVGIGTKF